MTKKKSFRYKFTQNPFWDYLNPIEVPIVLSFQNVFHMKNQKMHGFFEWIASFVSSRRIGMLPILMYSLGEFEKSQRLLFQSICVIFASTLTKNLAKRYRPRSFGIYCPNSTASSSFPSRHCCSSFIFSLIMPNLTLQVLFLLLMLINRIALGYHFPIDCLFGFFFGFIATKISDFLTNKLILLILYGICPIIWSSGMRVVSFTNSNFNCTTN